MPNPLQRETSKQRAKARLVMEGSEAVQAAPPSHRGRVKPAGPMPAEPASPGLDRVHRKRQRGPKPRK